MPRTTKRAPLPVCLSGNDLATGRVVYLTAAGGWSPALAKAARFNILAEAEAGLARTDPDRIVDPHLVALAANGPASARERVRAMGPFSLPRHSGAPDA